MRRHGSWSQSQRAAEAEGSLWRVNSARGSATSSLERRLVSEVRVRPQLYAGSRCSDLNNRGWQAVADALKLSVFECKRRWRMLLKQFKREYTTGKKSTWPYYDSLLFMLPYIKNHQEPSNHNKTNGGTSAVKQNFSFENNSSKTNSFIENAAQTNSFIENAVQVNSSMGNTVQPSSENSASHHSTMDENVHSKAYTDPDEHFLLSLLGSFKRLDEKQNATARIKISQILYNIEFGVQRKPRQFPQSTPIPPILIQQQYSDDGENSDSESIISIHDL